MCKLRILVLAVVGLLALTASAPALAAPGGDSNSGDVWLDNVGQPAGPGHEMDPHLACQDINLWGAGLADGSGTFTINGWPPSGGKEVDYSGNWSYDTAQGGDQVVATISVYTLISTASANGDSPAHNGFHFKLDFGQDPQKHKTFWVDCTSVPPAPATVKAKRVTRHRRHHHRRSATRHRAHRRHRHRRRISRRPRIASGFTG